MKAERVMALGALLAATGVMAGALGSHALRGVLAERQLQSFDTAVEYQIFNAIGLVLVGLLLRGDPDARLGWCARLLGAGILCFSGGIFIMLAGAPGWLGLVTPLGGLLLIGGWLLLALVLYGRSRAPGARRE